MAINVIGDLANPEKDAEAFDPVIQKFAGSIATALGAELRDTKLTISIVNNSIVISFEKKEQS